MDADKPTNEPTTQRTNEPTTQRTNKPTNKPTISPALRIAMAAILTALTVVFTYLVRVPVAPTRGYINLGDVAIYFTAFTFGPVTALIAGGLGTAIADLLAGYAQWAPISLLIHGLQGLAAGLIIKTAVRNKMASASFSASASASASAADEKTESAETSVSSQTYSTAYRYHLPVWGIVSAGLVGTIIMVALYFLAGGILVGFPAAAVEIPGNLIQNAVGILAGAFLAAGIYRAYPPIERLSW